MRIRLLWLVSGVLPAISCDFAIPHETWVADHPADWDAFKARMRLTLLSLPPEATVVRLELGRGMGESIHIWFRLPSTRTPPTWMRQMASDSGFPEARLGYYGADRLVDVNDPSSVGIEESRNRRWTIGPIDGGVLRYCGGEFEYCWTND